MIPPSAGPSAPDAAGESPPLASARAALADGSARGLDPRYVPCARIGSAIFSAVLCVASALGLAFLALGSSMRPARLVFLVVLTGAFLALVALSGWFYPPLKLRHCRWRLSPAGLEIRRGVWFRHLISVPRARVQHTDVERGPLERRFGLATLVVHTAGHQDSEIRLDGLEHETALSIRDTLLAAAQGDGA